MPVERLKPESFFDEENLKALKDLVPEAFADGKINWSTLKDALGGELEDDEKPDEHFGLFWPGKREARRLASKPSKGTLVPVKGEGINEDTTGNIFIEGENLEVLKLLRKSYAGRIKMIYIDPPYNTGNDFIYDDNFTMPLEEYLKYSGQMDGEGRPLTTNRKADGRFHSKWLSMMYPRLRLARELLKDDGVIFVSIDDNEVHNLRIIMDEIFGEENFIECITWNKRIPKNDKGIGSIHEYILIYIKNSEIKQEFIMNKEGLDEIFDLVEKVKRNNTPLLEAEEKLRQLYKKKGYDRGITLYNTLDKEYRLWGKINMSWPNANTFGPKYSILHPITQKPVEIPDRGWRWKEETFNEAAKKVDGEYTSIEKLHNGTYLCGKIWFHSDEKMQPSSVNYLEDVNTFLLRSVLSLKSDGGIEVERIFEGKSYFSYPKPTSLLKILIESLSMEYGDIVLDFVAGSATTANSVLDLNCRDGGNRKFIMIQFPEETDKNSEAYKSGFKNIAEIGKERIRRVIKQIESGENEKKKDEKEKLPGIEDEDHLAQDLGFRVFKLTSSHYKPWENYHGDSIEEIQGRFEDALTPLVENWKDVEDGLFTEILLLEGFPLDSDVTSLDEYAKNHVREVTCTFHENRLLICLDETLKKETIESLRLEEGDTFICLDTAINDETKTRLADRGLIKTI